MGMGPACVACRCRSNPGRAACAGARAPSTSGNNDTNTNTVVTAPGRTPPSATDNADTRDNTDRTDNVTATAPAPAADRSDTPDATAARVPGARCRPTDPDRARCPIAMCPIPAGWEESCAVVPSDRMEHTVTPELACCACDLCLFELVNGTGPCECRAEALPKSVGNPPARRSRASRILGGVMQPVASTRDAMFQRPGFITVPFTSSPPSSAAGPERLPPIIRPRLSALSYAPGCDGPFSHRPNCLAYRVACLSLSLSLSPPRPPSIPAQALETTEPARLRPAPPPQLP